MKRTPLKRKTPLKSYKPLKSRSRLKTKQKTARKCRQPYYSIFTLNMGICHITGDSRNVEPHHIFQGEANKVLSEKYGFMVPLRADWHRATPYSIHMDRKLNLSYKLRCQEYYINVLGKSREEWIAEFGRWWSEENEDE